MEGSEGSAGEGQNPEDVQQTPAPTNEVWKTFPIDPETGYAVDPDTGAFVDPVTGAVHGSSYEGGDAQNPDSEENMVSPQPQPED